MNRSVITILAERDAERDHTKGRCTPSISFRNRTVLDETCWYEYEQTYLDKQHKLDGGASVLDMLRTAGLL